MHNTNKNNNETIAFKIVNRKIEEDLGWFSSPSANVDLQKLHDLLQILNIDNKIANLT